jgi:hypothetical protein
MHSAARKYGGGRTPGNKGRLPFRVQTIVYARKMLQPTALNYLPRMFFPKLYFVPIVTRMVLRPPLSMSENML